MLSEEDFKYKYLQHPITFLTEENLDKLETHCRKAVNFERGVEYKVVLELLDKYYQYQKEIKDKNNKIIKLQKENEEKDKQIKTLNHTNKTYKGMLNKQSAQIDLIAFSLADYVMYYEYDKCRNPEMINQKAKELKQYYETKVKEEK